MKKCLIRKEDDPLGIVHLSFLPCFKINKRFINDKHSKWHSVGSALLVFILLFLMAPLHLAILYAWLLGFIWDIGDGFKPLWNQSNSNNFWINNLFYADGFSWSDVFVFDLVGVLVSTGLLLLIR